MAKLRGVGVQALIRCVALAVLIAGAAALEACNASASPSLVSKGAGAAAALTIEPFPPVSLKASRLELTLSDAGGQRIAGARVRLDLTMPGMEMPPNRLDLREAGAGLYRGEALFTMAGDWQIRAEAAVAGGLELFNFRVRVE
jgi:hypothetical protein